MSIANLDLALLVVRKASKGKLKIDMVQFQTDLTKQHEKYSNGLCRPCIKKNKKDENGNLKPEFICNRDGCEKEKYSRGLCRSCNKKNKKDKDGSI